MIVTGAEGKAMTAKAIFITGGASGIGRAVAVHFGGKGWHVGLGDINPAGMAETAALVPPGMASCHLLDVRDRGQWREALSAFAERSGGRLDVLFNNAGIARGGAFEAVAETDHDLVVDINLKGVINGAHAGLPYLKATPGACMINTSSAAGLYAGPGLAVYAATKFAVRGLTEALDQEWTVHGIKVRSLMPSFIDTPLLDAPVANSNQNSRERVKAAGLEFTPVETVAQAVWDAVHGDRVHNPVGRTAHRIAFWARWAPGMLLKRGRKLQQAE